MSSRPHAGLQLADTSYQAEASAYAQKRLRIFYGVMAVAATGFFFVDLAVVLGTGLWSVERTLSAPSLLHMASIVLAWGIYILLHLCPARARTRLGCLDAFGLYIAIGTCLGIYALTYKEGSFKIYAVLGLFLVARAVAVPSSALRTLLLSAPAAVGLGVIQLAHGTGYNHDGKPFATEAEFVHLVVWSQVTLLFAVFVAAVASRVNFALRRQARKALQLGQYRLEEKIGEGGMGEVYRASHAMLRRSTAIKLLRPEITGEETLRRFEREVQETSLLTHPNTVSIYDFGRTPDGVFYYAMEYLDGLDLAQVVARDGPLAPERVAHILRQACGALMEAHDHGLVHRDIKPGNLMLCRQGGEEDVVKVVDFGLVKDLGQSGPDVTQVGRLCGTPETIAPEVLNGAPASPASDQYALGAVGYYLLTGKQIFDAKTASEFIGHHLHTPPIPLRERRASVPEEFAAIILRSLEKDPADRFPRVADLRSALDAL